MSKKKREEINPNDYSYREESTVTIPAKTFEIMRGYALEQVSNNEAKPMILNVKPVFNKEKETIEWAEFESEEEYRSQRPVYMSDPEAVNAMFVHDLMTNAHIDNIEKGEAVDIETLKKEYQKANSKLKKVEE